MHINEEYNLTQCSSGIEREALAHRFILFLDPGPFPQQRPRAALTDHLITPVSQTGAGNREKLELFRNNESCIGICDR